MKKVKSFNEENCLDTSSECVSMLVELPFLGICTGDSLTKFSIEVVEKLQSIAGEDLSEFDLDALLDICNQRAPSEVTLISILTLIKNNEVCLKDFLNVLEQRLIELNTSSGVSVNLKCYAEFDNIGNPLSIKRNELDQLVINELCNHKIRLTSLESSLILLQNEVNNIDVNPIVSEPLFSTCIDGATKSTSNQVKSIATALCNEITAVGNPTSISIALAKTPATDATRYIGLTGWNPAPINWADNYNNLLLKLFKLEVDIIDIQTNCCAPTCDKIKIDFSMILDVGNDYILRFRATDGTIIPNGFVDAGSSVYFKDSFGNRYPLTGTLPVDVTEDESDPYDLNSLVTSSPITVYVNAKVSNSSIQCDKCLSKTIDLQNDSCPVCVITTSGTGTVTIIYSIPDIIVAP